VNKDYIANHDFNKPLALLVMN